MAPSSQIQKIALVGNTAGGKTRLSHALANRYGLPLIHVDQLQFLPGMKMRPLSETRGALKKITEADSWLIDGFGPLDLIESRFQRAECVIFVDLPLWRHFWWLVKRQLKSPFQTRPELPEACRENSLVHTQKLFKTLFQIHRKMRPELLRILARENLREKVIHVNSMQDWNRVFLQGL